MSSRGCDSSLPFEKSRIRATGASSSNWQKDSRSSRRRAWKQVRSVEFLVDVVILAPVLTSVFRELASCRFRIPVQEKARSAAVANESPILTDAKSLPHCPDLCYFSGS